MNNLTVASFSGSLSEILSTTHNVSVYGVNNQSEIVKAVCNIAEWFFRPLRFWFSTPSVPSLSEQVKSHKKRVVKTNLSKKEISSSQHTQKVFQQTAQKTAPVKKEERFTEEHPLNQLMEAFRSKDESKLLQLSADAFLAHCPVNDQRIATLLPQAIQFTSNKAAQKIARTLIDRLTNEKPQLWTFDFRAELRAVAYGSENVEIAKQLEIEYLPLSESAFRKLLNSCNEEKLFRLLKILENIYPEWWRRAETNMKSIFLEHVLEHVCAFPLTSEERGCIRRFLARAFTLSTYVPLPSHDGTFSDEKKEFFRTMPDLKDTERISLLLHNILLRHNKDQLLQLISFGLPLSAMIPKKSSEDKETVLERAINSWLVTPQEIIERLPFDSPSIIKDIVLLKEKYPNEADLDYLIKHLKWQIDTGQLSHFAAEDYGTIVDLLGESVLSPMVDLLFGKGKFKIDAALIFKVFSSIRTKNKNNAITFLELIKKQFGVTRTEDLIYPSRVPDYDEVLQFIDLARQLLREAKRAHAIDVQEYLLDNFSIDKIVIYTPTSTPSQSTKPALRLEKWDGAGMFTIFRAIIGMADRVERGEYSGIEVDFGTTGFYYDPQHGPNWLKDIIDMKNLQLPSAITLKKTGFMAYGAGDPENVITYLASSNARTRKEDFALITKYLPIKKELIDEFEAFINDNFHGKPYVAIHFRGTDKQEIGESRELAIEDAIEQIEKMIEPKYHDYPLFAASDESEFFTEIEKNPRLRERIVRTSAHLPMQRQKGEGVHFSSEISGYQKAVDALRDCYILSRSKFLIKTASNLGSYALRLNPTLEYVSLNRASGLYPIHND